MFGEELDEKEFSSATCNPHIQDSNERARVIGVAKQRAQSMLHDERELLKLISCIDLTTLNGDDTNAVVERLIDKALLPCPTNPEIRCAAVCVYPARITGARQYMLSKHQNLPLASVAAGFPAGQYRLESKLLEVKLAIEDGADEIDIVISRDAALEQDWKRVCNEIASLKMACGEKCMKTILATGELQNDQNIYRASWAAMLAGTDLIKTSTGKENVNATLDAAYVMCHAVKQFYCVKGKKVGFKAAGGIRSALDALEYQAVVKEILGTEWLKPTLFRIGASSLLNDVVEKINESKLSRH